MFKRNQEKLASQRVEALADAICALDAARSLADVQAIVRTAARALTGADGATVVFRDGDQCFYADEDAVSPLWRGERFPVNACLSGWAIANRTSALVADAEHDALIPVAAYRPSFIRSMAMVPIGDDAVGAVAVYWAERFRATDLHLRLLGQLADAAAEVLVRAELAADAENLAPTG